MQNLIIFALVGAAFLQTATTDYRVTRSDPVLVRFVIDGDTVDVASIGRVRLLGIDAPELGRGFETSAPFGREARDRLASLLLHRWVRLEQDGPTLDTYNRHLAYVHTEDGQFVNALLVREGLARVSARLPLTRIQELQRAEREAQTARRGMWGNAPVAPLGDVGRSDTRRPPASGTPPGPRPRRQKQK
ncbi:MAG: thermonuclease family protein [Vicinamibacterales bacterium]